MLAAIISLCFARELDARTNFNGKLGALLSVVVKRYNMLRKQLLQLGKTLELENAVLSFSLALALFDRPLCRKYRPNSKGCRYQP